MKLNHSKLKSFFYGTLLGDSYIHNGIFYCKQVSKDLMYIKYRLLKKHLPNAVVKIKEYDAYTDKNGVHHQKYYQLSVSKCRYVKKLEKIFYPNGVKIYPEHAILKLDDFGFAMWYADDGTTILVQYNENTNSARSRRIQICTDNFTAEEHEKIKQDLEYLGYNIKIIDRARRGQLRIQINNPRQDFICNISDYFYKYFPSLLYKMDLGYRGQSLMNRTYVSERYYNTYLKISAHPEFKDRLKNREDIVESTNT